LLLDDGWQVRGTARHEDGLAAIESAGIEAVQANPDRVATVLDHIEGVTAIGWLMGSARGDPEVLRALHGSRLERLCEELVDTPVRGIVYEADGSVPPEYLHRGGSVLSEASERWRIPHRLVEQSPDDAPRWVRAAAAAFCSLIRA